MSLSFRHGAVLILGGSSHLGRTVAYALMAAGVPVCLSVRNSQRQADLAHAFAASYPATVTADLSSPDAADSLILQVEHALQQQYGTDLTVGYLVDFLHTDYETLLAAAAPERISTYVESNITWRGRMLRGVSRHMLHHGTGRMLFVSSTAAVLPNAGQGLYSASKLAGEALYRNMGIELAAKGITTCSLRLGYVNAGRGAQYLQQTDVTTRIPMQRALSSIEVAQACTFLLCDHSIGINATTITMDGGLTACK